MVLTMEVYSKEFAGERIIINQADFNPEIHRRLEDGPWELEAETEAEAESASRRRRK